MPGGVGRKGEELVKDGPEPETGRGPGHTVMNALKAQVSEQGN